MIEQEMASIIKYVIAHAGSPSPYYWNVPKHFSVPAVYFPLPDVETGGETFLTYNIDYAWYIMLFHRTTQEAYAMALRVAQALRADRNLVPLISEDGEVIPESWVRVDDPQVTATDDGAVQLTVTWRSRRPYADVLEEVQTTRVFDIDVEGKTIEDAYADTLERYLS